MRQAIESFARHEIRSLTETSVVIQRRREDGSWDSSYATEIVAGALSHLIVTGDIDTVVFARHDGSLRSRLGWVAPLSHRGADFGYLIEKASIGMSCNRKLATEFVPELAETLVGDLASQAEADGYSDVAVALREIDPPRDESEVGSFIDALSEAGISDAWEYWSSVYAVDERVVNAWAACRRAAELIDAGAHVPPPEIAERDALIAERDSLRAEVSELLPLADAMQHFATRAQRAEARLENMRREIELLRASVPATPVFQWIADRIDALLKTCLLLGGDER